MPLQAVIDKLTGTNSVIDKFKLVSWEASKKTTVDDVKWVEASFWKALVEKHFHRYPPPPATIGDPRTNEAIIIPLYYLIL